MATKVLPLTVGPILGYTTGASARLWGRAALELVAGRPRPCTGVARIRPAGGRRYGAPLFFPMNPNFDMTGVVQFGGLTPETAYEYQIGFIFGDFAGLAVEPAAAPTLDWTGQPMFALRTAAMLKTRPRSFVFGSCRYLLRLFGGAWFDDRGDKTFRAILNQIDQGVQTDLLLMIGDQIYADDLSVIGDDEQVDQFLARYRDVFSQPYIRTLMGRLPTYMILDDHEIEDNWPSHADGRDMRVKYPAAMHAYLIYQASHSPILSMSSAHQLEGIPRKLWYTFSDGCADFFVVDARTERILNDDPLDRRMINEEQMNALLRWLGDRSGRVKFVVTSVPFFPDVTDAAGCADKWCGFLRQRDRILDYIREQRVRRVVFLGGDYHSGMKSEVVCPGAPDFRVLSLVSSPFFWPYPHNLNFTFRTAGPLATLSGQPYTVTNSSPIFSTDHFTRVWTDLNELRSTIYSRKGDSLYTTAYRY